MRQILTLLPNSIRVIKIQWIAISQSLKSKYSWRNTNLPMIPKIKPKCTLSIIIFFFLIKTIKDKAS